MNTEDNAAIKRLEVLIGELAKAHAALGDVVLGLATEQARIRKAAAIARAREKQK